MTKEETKVCSLCKEEKGIEKFYTYKSGNPWAYCKSCHYEKFTKKTKYAWDEQNPERRKELGRKHAKAWLEKNREKYNEYQRNWYKKKKQQQDGIEGM